MRSTKISPKKIKKFDVVILVTNHDNLDYKSIIKHSRLLVDTRGILEKKHSKVISL